MGWSPLSWPQSAVVQVRDFVEHHSFCTQDKPISEMNFDVFKILCKLQCRDGNTGNRSLHCNLWCTISKLGRWVVYPKKSINSIYHDLWSRFLKFAKPWHGSRFWHLKNANFLFLILLKDFEDESRFHACFYWRYLTRK